MPQAAPGGPVNAANLNFEGLDQVENVANSDLILVSMGAGLPNAFATVTQLLAGTGVPDPLLLGDGSVAAPSYSFVSSPGTGVFLNTPNQLAFAAGGLSCISIRNSAGARQVGFYDGVPISLQTGVAVTTAAVHAALVALRLITA